MSSPGRVVTEYGGLYRILGARDFLALMVATARNSSAILHSGKLTSVDTAMSRDMTIHYRGVDVRFPIAEVDRMLEGANDNPTFGNIREIYGRDCYLSPFRLSDPIGSALDLGANRGIFSILALKVLSADRVIGVEPEAKYEPVVRCLLEANHVAPERAPRYTRLAVSPSSEQADPAHTISIDSICEEHALDRLGFVKIDIEGFENDLFRESEWLARVDNIAMELHPHMVGDLSHIPQALQSFGLRFLSVDQAGTPRDVNHSMFLYASRTGALIA
jgi:hypothetical protein